MTTDAKPGLLDSKRIIDLELAIVDCVHRLNELERLLEARRNPMVVPSIMDPCSGVSYQTLNHPDSHS